MLLSCVCYGRSYGLSLDTLHLVVELAPHVGAELADLAAVHPLEAIVDKLVAQALRFPSLLHSELPFCTCLLDLFLFRTSLGVGARGRRGRSEVGHAFSGLCTWCGVRGEGGVMGCSSANLVVGEGVGARGTVSLQNRQPQWSHRSRAQYS